jgi:hypothetical protein
LFWLRLPLLPQVQREHHLPAGDFPDVARFRLIWFEHCHKYAIAVPAAAAAGAA